ncbi:diguanylate cyclase [Oscillospiraceae bacterium OttesenSCG-928-G22]|nr:diguanylate cyclase [Oscillospiraceae bacterium OttesenSCG-928-G22]
MTNNIMTLLYVPFLVILLLLLLSILRKKSKQYVERQYALYSLSLIGWLICELLFFTVSSPLLLELVFSLKFVFASYLGVLFFSLILGFYRLNRRIPQWVLPALGVAPTVTAILAVTNKFHSLFLFDFAVVSTGPLTVAVGKIGPLYMINPIGGLLPIAATFVLLLVWRRKLPKAYRTSSNLILTGISFYIACVMLVLVGVVETQPVDLSLLFPCVSALLLYIAIVGNGRADYLNIWQRDIFDYLDEPALILNANDTAVDCNRAAELLARPFSITMEGSSLEKIREDLFATGKVTIKPFTDEDGRVAGSDLYLLRGDYPQVFSISHRPIPDRDGAGAGRFITLSEVTRNRLLIERLRETAGVDSLTGLANRYRYQRILREIDVPDSLPLSIILGDVNGLKAVNDTYGHIAGDTLLQTIAEVLGRFTPEGGHAARLGGDEFAMLLPKTPPEEAERLIDDIHGALLAIHDFPYSPSIALGCTTKLRHEENINALFLKADRRMYSEKHRSTDAN